MVTTVTGDQLRKAQGHIDKAIEQHEAAVPELTSLGCLSHVLMELGIRIEVTS